MPKFLENPSLLTKDQLKTDLKTHGINLPKGDQKKQVYVDLYLQHLTSQNKSQNNGIMEFSSDEEKDKPSPKKPPQRSQKALIRKPVKDLPYDVNALSDGDLARQLRNYGQVVGPITETTRPLYQKKLIKLLQDEKKNPASVQLQNRPPKAWEYSDNEEETQELNRTFEVEKKPEVREEQENKHVISIQDDDDDDDDNVDAAEPPVQLTHRTKDRPRPPRESTPKKVIKRETVVSESHIETKKRVVTADKKPVEKTIESKVSSTMKTTTMDDSAKGGSSWEWKAVLVVLAIITTILLVYYFMEEAFDKPTEISNSN